MTAAHRRKIVSTAAVLAIVIGVGAGAGGAEAGGAPPPDTVEVVAVVDEAADVPSVAASAGAGTPEPTATGDHVVTMDVPADRLSALRSDPRVTSVMTRGHTVEPALAQSVVKVGASARHTAGFDGTGEVVVVIDTGVSAEFGGTIVGQACFAAGSEGGNLVGHCDQGSALESFSADCFALGVCVHEADPAEGDVEDPDAGAPCSGGPGCQHGSAVAAVAARHAPTPGVAPGAGVYSIRVFDPTGSNADLLDVFLALQHVIDMVDAGFDVAAVNLSVSTLATFPSPCNSLSVFGGAPAVFHQTFLALAEREIPVAVASGNAGKQDELGFPACVSSAVAVGASDLDDRAEAFGDRGPGLDMFAPGADRWTAGGDYLDVPSAPGFNTQVIGTSFSAPHVAGAFALLAEQFPNASLSQRWWYLATAGVRISLPDGRKVPRLRLRAAGDVMLARTFFPGTTRVGGTGHGMAGDLDGDGRDDVLSYVAGSAADTVSYGRTDWSFDVAPANRPGTFTPLVGNFRGGVESPDDILWYAPGTSADHLWVGSPSRTLAPVPVSVNGSYQPLVGNFDGDGWDDIFWYAPGTAPDYIWFGGPSGFASVGRSANGTYRVAIGDFDANGSDDIIFHAPGTAPDGMWLTSAARSHRSVQLTFNGSYRMIVLDQDGDGAEDVLLYETREAPDHLLSGGPGVGGRSGGVAGFGSHPRSVATGYTPFVGDFDDDGRDDLFWYRAGTTRDMIWFGRPGPAYAERSVVVNGTYHPVVGDFDADGGDDVIWYGKSKTPPAYWSYVGPG